MSRNLLSTSLYTVGTFTRDTPHPQAIQYNGNTYLASVEENGDIIAFKYSNGSTTAPFAYKVGYRSDFPLSDVQHATPGLCIDTSGYIYIFYGGHDTQLYFRKSTNPEDITTWNALGTVTGASAASYPNPFVIGSKIYVIFRNLDSSNINALHIISSSDGGTTWGNNTTLLSEANISFYIEGHFLGSETPTPSIHVLVNPRNFPAGTHTTFQQPCHLKSLDGGSTWKNSSGTTITLPGTTANTTSIRADTLESWSGDLKVNSQGNPYITYILSNSNQLHFALWNGSSWIDTNVASSPTYNYEHAELDIVSDSIIDIYTPTGLSTTGPGGNIVRYRSIDSGGTFSLAENITSDASILPPGPRYFYPRIVRNYLSDIKLIYSYGIVDATNSNSWCTYKTYPTAINTNMQAGDRVIPRDFGTCLKFNGTNAYALLGPSSNLNVFGGSTGNIFTITFWAKLTLGLNSTGGRFFNESNSSTGFTHYSIYPSDQGDPKKLRMWAKNEANTQLLLGESAGSVLVTNQWVLIGVVDNNGIISVYSSAAAGYPNWERSGGNLNYTRSGSFTVNRTSIGARVYTTQSQFLNGLMDDVRIWKGTAITQQQFKDLYYLGINPSIPTAWYKADEGSGTSLTDSSGNGNTGVLTNAIYSTDVAMKLRIAASNRVAITGRKII